MENNTAVNKTIEIRRTNSQTWYGAWLGMDESDKHGEIPAWVYDAAADEMVEGDGKSGEVEVGGSVWEWRKK